MNRLRNRLILVFLAATLVPLAATVWITTSLLEWSLNFSTTDELERLSRTLERTGQEFYRRQRDDLKQRRRRRVACSPSDIRRGIARSWPAAVKEFADSTEAERFVRRRAARAIAWITWCGTATRSGRIRRSLGDVAMDRVARRDPRRARAGDGGPRARSARAA